MRLKRVRVFGFKTFADRTEFDIDGGIVAVVGPNGCGKSNLVDAILWGLGEASARHLRAQTSQDVIFGGSAKRKSLGFAEVSLLFDNEDGSLPIPTAEVSVSRRVNRAGESEYSINKQPCRQRDIYDLLADSGLGRSGYAIVSQKEIDQALAASPEERRGWVDEAAGVQRYRARKVEAHKRLTAAQGHLQRVSDVLRELEVQREPMREEAEVARRYRTTLNALREVEIGLLVRDLARAVREIGELEGKISDAQKMADEESRRAEKAERDSQQTSEKAAAIEREIEVLWAAQQRALTAKERAEADLRLAEQKLAGLDDVEKSLGDEAGMIERRLAEAKSELEHLREEHRVERESLERIEVECAGAGEEAKRLAKELDALEKELAAARAIHAQRLKQEAEEAHRKERIVLLKRELAGIQRTLPDLEAAAKEAEEAASAKALALRAIEEEIARLEALLFEETKQDEEDAKATRAWMAELAALDGRRRGIENTIESHEGLNQGARAVIDAVQKKELRGEFIPVGEAIETEKEFALAIETALGGSVNDLIVERSSAARDAIAWLKENRTGRATFQPLDLVQAPELKQELRKVLQDKGVVGRAAEVVRCEDRHRNVIESLLGRVVLAKSIDDALRLAGTGGWHRIVTLDGEVVTNAGAVTGGRTAKGAYGMVQRKADLSHLVKEIARLERQIRDAEKRAQTRQTEREGAQAQVAKLRARAKEDGVDLGDSRAFAREIHDELQSTLKSKGRVETELQELSSIKSEAIQELDMAGLEKRRDETLRQLAAKSADAEGAEERMRDAQNRLRQSEVRMEAGERRILAAQEAEDHRQRRLFTLEPDRERMRKEIESHRKERDKAEGERAKSETKLEEMKSKRQALVEQALQLGDQARQARANAVSVVDGVHQAELSRARAESRRATAAERLLEEYSLTEQDALAQEGMHEVPSDAPGLVQRLRRELRAMGDVNLGAVDAYERLTERVEELEKQRADIQEGIDQVLASMTELDSLTRERFLSTFEAVRVAFADLFQKLFAGGEGSLHLTDPNSILETGVEIDVTLPGKKKQRLELLSGGERSLCACAFLFALLRVKPSPLVVLDEVDAPLDGRNVERFVALLHEFAETMQFIVVTHNRETIKGSPVWLGVTMQEPGVSTLIPTRVPIGEPTRSEAERQPEPMAKAAVVVA